MELKLFEYNVKHFEIDKPVNHQSGNCKMVIVIDQKHENPNNIFSEKYIEFRETNVSYYIDNCKIVLLNCRGKMEQKNYYAIFRKEGHKVFVIEFEFYEMVVQDKQAPIYNEKQEIIA